jgi:hypothetical protein
MRLAALAVLSLLAVPAALAQEEVTCVGTPNHVVAERPNVEEIGSAIAVYPAGHACTFDPAEASLVLEGWYHFEDTVEDFLVVSEGSAISTWSVVDLASNEVVVSFESEDAVIDGTMLTYWEPVAEGTADNCAEYDEFMGYGGSAVVTEQSVFDFTTLVAQPTGQSRCEYRQ